MNTFRLRVASAIGPWVVEGDDDGLTAIHLPNDRVRASTGTPPAAVAEAARQLTEYFDGSRQSFDVDLHLTGTAFQQEVWLALAAIPFGQVRTYGDIAATLGRPHAYRAVGNANGKNPWPIIVPCHRVVGAGTIGGYAGGLDVKEFLLALEGVTRVDIAKTATSR